MRHDPRSCPMCGPAMARPAYAAGEARAEAMHPPRVTANQPEEPVDA